MASELVPVVFFLAIAATYCLKYYFAYRGRHDAQQTVRIALERGDRLTWNECLLSLRTMSGR